MFTPYKTPSQNSDTSTPNPSLNGSVSCSTLANILANPKTNVNDQTVQAFLNLKECSGNPQMQVTKAMLERAKADARQKSMDATQYGLAG